MKKTYKEDRSAGRPVLAGFITERRNKESLTQFDLSVAITNSFIEVLKSGPHVPLITKAEPPQGLLDQGAYKHEDGVWVYEPQADLCE